MLERLPPVNALKLSFYAYPLVNALHILAIGALVTAVMLMDLRILGGLAALPRGAFLGAMRRTIALALTAAVLSGLALFSIRAQEYATNFAFLAKMTLLAAAGLNLLAFRLVRAPPGDGIPYPPTAKALAVLSMAIWTLVLVAGRFIGFI